MLFVCYVMDFLVIDGSSVLYSFNFTRCSFDTDNIETNINGYIDVRNVKKK